MARGPSKLLGAVLGSGNWVLRAIEKEPVHAAIAFPTLGFLIEIDSDCSNGQILGSKRGTSFSKINSNSVVDRVYLMKRRLKDTNGWESKSLRGRLRSLNRYDLEAEAVRIFRTKGTYDLLLNNCQHLANQLADYATY